MHTNGQTSYKIVLLGNSGVGKSTTLHRYFLGEKNTKITATISANFHSVSYSDNIKLNLWDTAGQCKFRSICPIYYRGSSACIVVFDVTDKQSYNDTNDWVSSYKTTIDTDNPLILLIANKIDYPIDQWQVTYQDIQMLANTFKCDYVLTSGIRGTNMDVFHITMRKLCNKMQRQNAVRDLTTIPITCHELPEPEKNDNSCYYSSCALNYK